MLGTESAITWSDLHGTKQKTALSCSTLSQLSSHVLIFMVACLLLKIFSILCRQQCLRFALEIYMWVPGTESAITWSDLHGIKQKTALSCSTLSQLSKHVLILMAASLLPNIFSILCKQQCLRHVCLHVGAWHRKCHNLVRSP